MCTLYSPGKHGDENWTGKYVVKPFYKGDNLNICMNTSHLSAVFEDEDTFNIFLVASLQNEAIVVELTKRTLEINVIVLYSSSSNYLMSKFEMISVLDWLDESLNQAIA